MAIEGVYRDLLLTFFFKFMLPFMCQSKLFYKPFFFYLLNKLILTINSSLIILFRKTNFKVQFDIKRLKEALLRYIGKSLWEKNLKTTL